MALLHSAISYLLLSPVSVLAAVVCALVAYFIHKSNQAKCPINPFATDSARPPELRHDKDSVIKQGFAQKKIPADLDAIVIGSGIGGLTAAAILAKTGKKVLVLEQHDQAGGCCHAFSEKGYEFDVGIHYVGKIQGYSYTRTLLDQISDGQIQWQPLDENFDTVVLGRGESKREVKLRSGPQYREALVEAFPDETEAIDKFLTDLKEMDNASLGIMLLKMFPAWFMRVACWSGLLDMFVPYRKWTEMTTQQYLDGITTNEQLKAVFSYAWGDYGTPPNKSCPLMNASLMNHFRNGCGYPLGGAAQIAFNIIPVIERAGGKVLVRANVTEVLMDIDGNACGVKVTKGQQDSVLIHAPIVISNAGVCNTLRMVPRSYAQRSTIAPLLQSGTIKTGYAAVSLFVGLKGNTKEFGLKAQNIWSFSDANMSRGFENAMRLDITSDSVGELPLLFTSFPSTKDPSWQERNPDKTTCTVITLVNYDWFKQWEDKQIKHRGDDYEELKDKIAKQMWSQVLDMYPQLADRVEYFELGSPLSNNYYLGSRQGEIYGLDHDLSRWRWDVQMKLKPDIGIKGLYLTGQDILSCGFSGALYGGLLCAGAILNRNLYDDCLQLHKQRGPKPA